MFFKTLLVLAILLSLPEVAADRCGVSVNVGMALILTKVKSVFCVEEEDKQNYEVLFSSSTDQKCELLSPIMQMLFDVHDLIFPGSGKYVKTKVFHEGVFEKIYDRTTENVSIIDTAVRFDAVDAIPVRLIIIVVGFSDVSSEYDLGWCSDAALLIKDLDANLDLTGMRS